MEAGVTCVIPWMRALPDLVALGSFSTELGDVNTCLYAWDRGCYQELGRHANMNQPILEVCFEIGRSTGLPDRTHIHDKGRPATDHQGLPTPHCVVSP